MAFAMLATACHRLVILANVTLTPDGIIFTRPFAGSSTSMFDAEGMAYDPINNTLWLADDNGDALHEINATTGALVNTLDSTDLDLSTEFGGSAQAGPDRTGDFEAVAYDVDNDTLYAVSDGCCQPTSAPTIFRLVRSGSTFVAGTWQPLTTDHTAAAVRDGQLYLTEFASIYPYDYVTNTLGSPFTIPSVGTITGMTFARDGFDAWITAANTVYRVDWATKTVIPGYDFGAADHGLNDARAVEVVEFGLNGDHTLYIQDGDDTLSGSDPLKYAIYIFQISGDRISTVRPNSVFSVDANSGLVPHTVTVDGSASNDPDGTIEYYHFIPGDGTSRIESASPSIQHTYTTPGVYTAFTVAEDDGGFTGVNLKTITVKEINVAPVLDPVGNQVGTQGTETAFTATASDTNVPVDDLVFSLDDGASGSVPTGATIDPDTGAFSWTPDGAQQGVFTFDVVVTDNGFPPLDDSETITVTVADANVAPELDPIGPQNAIENTLLSFTATATDTDVPPDTLTFTLDNGASGSVPAGAAITTGGDFTWTPLPADKGVHTFDVVVTDDGSPNLEDRETITVTVDEVNQAPVLDPVGNQVIDELVELTFTATATDPNVPADQLTFSLADGASGSVPGLATIDPNTGAFSWTPGESRGGTVATFDVVVTDDGFPTLSDSETIAITINEANQAPVLDPIGNRTLIESELTSFTATASDADSAPANTLTFSLDPGAAGSIPAGPTIDPNTGLFSWTPNAAQAPGVFTFDIVVTDDGTPNLEDRETITWTVLEINVAPSLDPIGAQVVDELVELDFTATASDANLPAQGLTFSLDDGASGSVPPGAAIDPNTGDFSWTPGEADGGSVFTFDVIVTDDHPNPLADSETITVTVNDVNVEPVLDPIGGPFTIEELQLLTFTATASDSDVPADAMTFTLANGASGSVPAGAAIDPNTGVFTWTPSAAQAFAVHTFDVVVTDDGVGTLSDSETVTVTVEEINEAPVLGAIGPQNSDEQVELAFTATATDPNTPPDTLTFSLDDGASGSVPGGASIDPNTGAFSWTPGEAEDGVYTFDVVVTDDGAGTVGPLSDSETITVTINEVNIAPVLDPVGNQSLDEQTLLSFTATASDVDLPANTLTFSLDNGASGSVPAGAAITPSGDFTWTPTDLQDGVHTFDVVVTDDGTGTLSDSETITVTVNDVNVAPVLDPVGNQAGDELAELTFTATATDADLPADGLTFTLDDGASGSVPAGASIDPNTGAFSWTPTEAQDGVHTFDVVVTDDGTPNLEDRETITVTIGELNVGPTLDPIGPQNVDELTLLTFTATASDPDVIASVPDALTFSLDPGAGGGVPAGPAIDPNTGVFTWTPSEAQGPGVYTFDVVVTDGGSLEDRETIIFTVNEVP